MRVTRRLHGYSGKDPGYHPAIITREFQAFGDSVIPVILLRRTMEMNSPRHQYRLKASLMHSRF